MISFVPAVIVYLQAKKKYDESNNEMESMYKPWTKGAAQTCSDTVRLIFPIHPIHGSGEDVSVTIERRDRLRPRERKREQSGVLTGVRRPCTGVFWDTISCSKAAPPASWLAQWVGVGCIAFEVSLALCWGDAMQAAARSLTRRRTTRMRRRSELVAVREELPR